MAGSILQSSYIVVHCRAAAEGCRSGTIAMQTSPSYNVHTRTAVLTTKDHMDYEECQKNDYDEVYVYN